ncbi:hypothetical protein RHGRI_026921 [Rhododendron griersonianum]|uniref:Uncharacterized protein n=1 Tax=Rhododendron griersonianum TaxID=479676 RepID=A0AAV6IUI9_9ERIC|nr:hypothetical protein RHGRI_026921 [Rhododendron griersonianum]
MKIFVKTLKGTHFEIEVNPDDTNSGHSSFAICCVRESDEKTVTSLVSIAAVVIVLLHAGYVKSNSRNRRTHYMQNSALHLSSFQLTMAQVAIQSKYSKTVVHPKPRNHLHPMFPLELTFRASSCSRFHSIRVPCFDGHCALPRG